MIPTVGFLHTDVRGCYIDHALKTAPRAARRFAEHLVKRYLIHAFAGCSTIIAPSEFAGDVLRWAGIRGIVVVPHGIPAPPPVQHRGGGHRRTSPVAVYAGRFSTEKNLAVILRALPGLHEQLGLVVVMVGEGHMRPTLEAFAHQHPGLLTVLGFEPDRNALRSLLTGADVFLAPCPYETFGLAAVEAMAVGTPVVGAAQGAIGELLSHTGGGIPFEAHDPASLRLAVLKVLERRDELSIAARAHVANHYQLDKTMPQLVGVYERASTA